MAYSATRRTLASILTRNLSSPTPSSFSSSSFSARYRFALAVLNQQPQLAPNSVPTRLKSSGSGHSPLNDPSPNWSNRPPKETILLDGCDYEHWLIVMEFPEASSKPSEEEMVNSYVKTLATALGSDEGEAKKKIYSVSTTTYTGFGAAISEELSQKVKGLPGVLWVLPDSYLDVQKKDYGGDLFVDGKVIPRPQYRFTNRQQPSRNRPRPRHDRHREMMQVERKEPEPVQNKSDESKEPLQQPSSTDNAQNAAQVRPGDFSVNQ